MARQPPVVCRLQQDPETHAFRVAICLCWPFHSSCGSVPFSSGVVVSWSCMAVYPRPHHPFPRSGPSLPQSPVSHQPACRLLPHRSRGRALPFAGACNLFSCPQRPERPPPRSSSRYIRSCPRHLTAPPPGVSPLPRRPRSDRRPLLDPAVAVRPGSELAGISPLILAGTDLSG